MANAIKDNMTSLSIYSGLKKTKLRRFKSQTESNREMQQNSIKKNTKKDKNIKHKI